MLIFLAKPRMLTKKRHFSPHVPGAKKQKMASMGEHLDANEAEETSEVDPSEGRRIDLKPGDEPGDGSDGSDKSHGNESGDEIGEQIRPEYTPRKRASQHDDEIEVLAEARDDIVNVVPPFPAGVINTWDQFDSMFEEYKRKNNLKFRVRSSMKTEMHNQ
jgi:hypothetical protein